jgi:hypothetical protein
MIIIGSAILFAFGMAILFVQTIRIAISLLKIAYYLIKLAVVLTFTAVCTILLALQWCVRGLTGIPEQEPVITINVYSDDDEEDAPTIELPRGSFRRVRG